MDWNRAKSILIVFMLGVNIFLGANILMMFSDSKREENQAVINACAIEAEQGTEINAEDILAMPSSMKEYVFSRNEESEAAAAERILGSFGRENPGGGIYSYISEKGQAVFRNGGYTELDGIDDPSAIESFLTPDKKSGLELVKDGEGYGLKIDGVPVSGASFTEEPDGGMSGSWIFGRPSLSESQSMSRYSAVLALGRLMKSENAVKAESVEEAYVMTSVPGGDIKLTPAWRVVCGRRIFYINVLTGEEIPL